MLRAARQHAVHIVDRQVDHEVLGRRQHVIGVGLERAEHRARAGMRRHRLGRDERAAPVLHLQAQHLLVPLDEGLLVLRLEEDAADPDHPRHGPFPLTDA